MTSISPLSQQPSINPAQQNPREKESIRSLPPKKNQDSLSSARPSRGCCNAFFNWIKNWLAKIWNAICCKTKEKPAEINLERLSQNKTIDTASDPNVNLQSQPEQKEKTVNPLETSCEASSESPSLNPDKETQEGSPANLDLDPSLFFSEIFDLEPQASSPKKPGPISGNDQKKPPAPAMKAAQTTVASNASHRAAIRAAIYRGMVLSNLSMRQPQPTLPPLPLQIKDKPNIPSLSLSALTKPDKSKTREIVCFSKAKLNQLFAPRLATFKEADAKEMQSFKDGKKEIYGPLLSFQRELLKELNLKKRNTPYPEPNMMYRMRVHKTDNESYKVVYGTSLEPESQVGPFGIVKRKDPFSIVDAVVKSTEMILNIASAHRKRLDELQTEFSLDLDAARPLFFSSLKQGLSALKKEVEHCDDNNRLEGLANRNLGKVARDRLGTAIQELEKLEAPPALNMESYKRGTKETDQAIKRLSGYLQELYLLLGKKPYNQALSKKEFISLVQDLDRKSFAKIIAKEEFIVAEEIAKTLSTLFALIDKQILLTHRMLRNASGENNISLLNKLLMHYCSTFADKFSKEAAIFKRQEQRGELYRHLAAVLEKKSRHLAKLKNEIA